MEYLKIKTSIHLNLTHTRKRTFYKKKTFSLFSLLQHATGRFFVEQKPRAEILLSCFVLQLPRPLSCLFLCVVAKLVLKILNSAHLFIYIQGWLEDVPKHKPKSLSRLGIKKIDTRNNVSTGTLRALSK